MRCAQLGKDVRVVSRDPPPPPLLVFPGVADIEIAERVDDPGDAVIVMECGDLAAHRRRRASSAASSSTSITIPATRCTAR